MDPVDFLSRANLSIQGQTVRYNTTAALIPTDEVLRCEAMGMLVRRGADGLFPEPPPPEPVRCCGG